MAAITYTAEPKISGPTFTCSRCRRTYAYPADHGKPIRCECGWWYYNVGHGRFTEYYRPRIGGASLASEGAAAAAETAAGRTGHG